MSLAAPRVVAVLPLYVGNVLISAWIGKQVN
jgi:hypothetical protein